VNTAQLCTLFCRGLGAVVMAAVIGDNGVTLEWAHHLVLLLAQGAGHAVSGQHPLHFLARNWQEAPDVLQRLRAHVLKQRLQPGL
jgi:hypothetical protein